MLYDILSKINSMNSDDERLSYWATISGDTREIELVKIMRGYVKAQSIIRCRHVRCYLQKDNPIPNILSLTALMRIFKFKPRIQL